MPARILIIEDDSFSRDLLTYLVEASGYLALSAEDGGAGVEAALQQRPDLVLCDMQMPVLNGEEVMRRLLATPGWRRVPVIAVSAFSLVADRDTALAAGFDDHVTKPITPETFVQKIETHLPPSLRVERPPHA